MENIIPLITGRNLSRHTGTMCNTSTKVVTIMTSLIESGTQKDPNIRQLSDRLPRRYNVHLKPHPDEVILSTHSQAEEG